MSKDLDYVTIFEDWNERDGKIYYRYRFEGEKEWHEKLTAHKQKPFIRWQLLTPKELESKLERLDSVETQS